MLCCVRLDLVMSGYFNLFRIGFDRFGLLMKGKVKIDQARIGSVRIDQPQVSLG
jgi:hypothetical protein